MTANYSLSEGESKARFLRIAAISLAIGFLFIGCFTIISPFLPAIVLGAILTLATWPAFSFLNTKLGDHPNLVAAAMSLMLALLFVVPLFFLGETLVDNFRVMLGGLTSTLAKNGHASPPWLEQVPIVGSYLSQTWQEYSADREKLLLLLQEHAGTISNWMLAVAGALGRGIADISLAVIFSFFMFRHGYTVSTRIASLADRIIGPRAESLITLTKGTLIGVIYGVLGTAVVQAILAAIGFVIAGVPGAPLLGLMTFFFAVIPVGPPIIWGGATIWLIMQDQIGWAIFMGLWGFIAVSSLDNVFRLYFISLGAKLPILLILLGVFGGLLAFGFIGLFVGPTLLAIGYNLLLDWSAHNTTIMPGVKDNVIYAGPPEDVKSKTERLEKLPAASKQKKKPVAKPKK